MNTTDNRDRLYAESALAFAMIAEHLAVSDDDKIGAALELAETCAEPARPELAQRIRNLIAEVAP